MSDVTLTITDPIYINTIEGTPNTDILLTIEPPHYIGVVDSEVIQVETDPVFQGWLEASPPLYISFGDKSSATDEGILNSISLGDDYVYFCTVSGTAGNAVWKRTPLFKAP